MFGENDKGSLYATRPEYTLENGDREILGGPFKIGHMADLHMDDGFTVAGRVIIDATTGMNERLLDIYKCTLYAVDKMIECGCRACLIAGDATETHNPSPNVQKYLLKCITNLAEHMPVFIEPGNHCLSKNPKDATALEFLKGRKNIFVVESPTVFYQEGFAVNTEPSPQWPQKDCAKIFVLPFPSKAIINGEGTGKTIADLNKSVSDKLRIILHSFRGQIDSRVPNILMLHVTVAGAKGAENAEMLKFDPVLFPEDLLGFDYVALGHIHEYQKISPGLFLTPDGDSMQDNSNIFYSGSIDRMDFNEEGQPKGFIITTFNGRKAIPEFIETPARTFKTLTPDFFANSLWKEKIDLRTYRIKGEVSKEEYEILKPLLREFPVPILNKLTVKRSARIRDAQMTEELKESEAIKRYLGLQGIGEELLQECLKEHENIGKGNSR